MASPSDPVNNVLSALGSQPTHPVISPLENFFGSIGLMRGSLAPVWRAGFGFAVGSLVVFAIRPAAMFLPDGSPRPWSALKNQRGLSTSVPWWLPGTVLAIGSGLFV